MHEQPSLTYYQTIKEIFDDAEYYSCLLSCLSYPFQGGIASLSGEIVEIVEWIGVNACCVQEVGWIRVSARILTSKAHTYKHVWEGKSGEIGSVDIFRPGITS